MFLNTPLHVTKYTAIESIVKDRDGNFLCKAMHDVAQAIAATVNANHLRIVVIPQQAVLAFGE